MRALLSITPGGPETLELTNVDSKEPKVGELRVNVLACGINYPDVLMIEDKYQFKPDRPFAPGTEISGVVEAIGEGVENWNIGDRLISIMGYGGGLAEQAIVKADEAYKISDKVDPVEGAALVFTYATTLHALADRAELKNGETLLVLGAAGGVGLAAIEIGKAMGARVVAAVSSDEKATAALEVGADDAIVYDRGPLDKGAQKSLSKAFKEAVGDDGAHVIYDPVGGDYSEPALRSIAWEGRYLVVGFAAGIPKLPLNLTLLKACDVRGVFWGGFFMRNPERNRRHVSELLEWWSSGKIRPRIDAIYSLEDGGKAIERLSSRSAIGKVVVRPN